MHMGLMTVPRRRVRPAKVDASAGESWLIPDVVMEAGAQTASGCFPPKPDRRIGIDGMVPRRIAADGGPADIDDSNSAQARQAKDPAFHKTRGMTVDNTAQSTWGYRALRNAKDGIAAGEATSSMQVVPLSVHAAILGKVSGFEHAQPTLRDLYYLWACSGIYRPQ